MKKHLLIALFILPFAAANGQTTSLFQDFNTACAVNPVPGWPWVIYSPAVGQPSSCLWECTSTHGRPSATSTPTPGMSCTNVDLATYYLDTSYLVSPLLDLTLTSGNIYLHFDTKTTYAHLGEMHVIISTDTPLHIPGPGSTDLTPGITPVIGPGDSTDWVTHQVNLTPYKAHSFYVAFRYVGTVSYGTTWYIDNINTSSADYHLSITNANQPTLPISLTGNATSSQVAVTFGSIEPGTYNIALFDLLGRELYNEPVTVAAGVSSYSITGLNLHAGMYIIKMGDRNTYGTAKVMVP